MSREYLYFFRYTNENFRSVILIPNSSPSTHQRKLSDIEGIFISEKEVPHREQKFPITRIEEISTKYSGRIIRLSDFS